MKNKISVKNKDFRQLRTKIFIQTMLIMLSAIGLIFALYIFVLHGNFANFWVSLFIVMFDMDYYQALDLYQYTFRNNMEMIFLLTIVMTFFIIFRIYLNRFTRYFIELNDGMDSLINENTSEISLSPELLPMERKLNTIKHEIEKQKVNMQTEEQRKNDLIMYLAHDLKTPLASVIGYLNLLHDEKLISDELREKYIAISLDKAEHLEELINEFFEIARFNLSNITLQYSEINLTLLLEQLTYEFSPMLKEKNLTCKLSMNDNIMLKCDAGKIQRVFDNILRNAIIYSHNNTEINIIADVCDNSVVVRFINRGITIPKEKIKIIFEQFYRLDAARNTAAGAGLGLAIAKHIVELHKGTITADSSDELTEFSVTLPLFGAM